MWRADSGRARAGNDEKKHEPPGRESARARPPASTYVQVGTSRGAHRAWIIGCSLVAVDPARGAGREPIRLAGPERPTRAHSITSRAFLSDRDRSIFREPISMGSKRCLYLGRWTSRTSSGRRFGSSFPAQSASERPTRAGGRGATLATFFTASCGCFAQAHPGQTCLVAIRRTQRAFVGFRSGNVKASSTRYWPRSRATCTREARSTSPRRSSTAATPAQKKGSSGWENSTRQSDQDHGSGRPPWSSYRHRDCEWRAP
jgi:hypothetical protein